MESINERVPTVRRDASFETWVNPCDDVATIHHRDSLMKSRKRDRRKCTEGYLLFSVVRYPRGEEQLIFHFPPVPSSRPPPIGSSCLNDHAKHLRFVIKKSSEGLVPSFIVYPAEDPAEFIKPGAHWWAQHTRDGRCAWSSSFLFSSSLLLRERDRFHREYFQLSIVQPGGPRRHPFGIRWLAAFTAAAVVVAVSGLRQKSLPNEQIAAVFRDSAIGIYLLH